MSVEDSGLVVLELNRQFLKFIFIVGVVFFSLTCAWDLLSPWLVLDKVPIAFTTGESNLAKIVRMQASSEAIVGLVGTSIMDRLEPEFFVHEGVLNFALEGGSSVTGLEVILRRKVPLAVVYIETNFVSNHPDAAILEKTKGCYVWQILSGAIKPFRYLLADTSLPELRESAVRRLGLLSTRVAEYHNEAEVQKGVDWYTSEEGIRSRGDPKCRISVICTRQYPECVPPSKS